MRVSPRLHFSFRREERLTKQGIMGKAFDRRNTGSMYPRLRVVAFALAGVVACGEYLPTSPPPVSIPVTNPLALGALRGRVDVVAGTLTFESTQSSAILGASLSIYGDQHVSVRVYNGPVTQTLVGAKRLFSANVGIRNLRNHHIGDEQAGASPADISGIYVFFSSDPTVSSTSSACPACTVIVQNNQGTMAFNAPGQKYFHWQERLGPFGGGSDTTLSRKTWTFEADSAVKNFSFDVMVSAAWPSPNETRWKTVYDGDSLPDTQSEPRWRRQTSGVATVISLAGLLSITADRNEEVSFFRQDSIAQDENAYAETTMRLLTIKNNPQVALSINDGARYTALALDNGDVGFINSGGNFIGGTYKVSTLTFHAYQLRKYADDSAVIFVDGVRRLKANYTSLSASAATSQVKFGSLPTAKQLNVSEWDYVIYEIGATQP